MNVWDPQPVMPGQRLHYRLPPCDLWIKRTSDECHTGLVTPAPLALKNAIERPESDPNPITWERFAVPDTMQRILVRPALPDRALVVRPAETMRIVKGHATQLFVGIPVWWRIEWSATDGSETFLTEYPSVMLSKSWFGQPAAGESCYALKTRARHVLEEAGIAPNRATCAIRLQNLAGENLLFERFCLRAPNLTLYAAPDGRLWTGDVHVQFMGTDQPATVQHLPTAPAKAPEAKLVTPARKGVTRGFTARAFTQIRTMAGIG